MSFSATTHQNEFLPAGTGEVHAIVTVTADEGLSVASTSGDRCIALVVDTSGSMSNPMGKIHAARRAVAAAVGSLPDGVRFCVIAGDHEAKLVYPTRGRDLAIADEGTRQEAVAASKGLQPSGGTAISTWLDLTREMMDGYDGIKLAYLLTDGKNESETAAKLDTAIAACVGEFQCDARGVGDAWEVDELRRISHALLGEVDIVKNPDQMDEDFEAFLERALGKAVTDVRLKVWTPKGSTIRFVKQVAPTIEDVTSQAQAEGPLVTAWPTGAWAAGESRDYHLCVDVPVGDVGQEKLAARVMLDVDGDQVSQGLVRALWTEDHALTTRIDPQVAHYTGQAELATAIQEGLKARKAGDEAGATVKLGRAVQLAHESGNDATVRLLAKVVEVEDPATGTVRLKKKVEDLDEMELDTRSTRTVRVTAKGEEEA